MIVGTVRQDVNLGDQVQAKSQQAQVAKAEQQPASGRKAESAAAQATATGQTVDRARFRSFIGEQVRKIALQQARILGQRLDLDRDAINGLVDRIANAIFAEIEKAGGLDALIRSYEQLISEGIDLEGIDGDGELELVLSLTGLKVSYQEHAAEVSVEFIGARVVAQEPDIAQDAFEAEANRVAREAANLVADALAARFGRTDQQKAALAQRIAFDLSERLKGETDLLNQFRSLFEDAGRFNAEAEQDDPKQFAEIDLSSISIALSAPDGEISFDLDDAAARLVTREHEEEDSLAPSLPSDPPPSKATLATRYAHGIERDLAGRFLSRLDGLV